MSWPNVPPQVRRRPGPFGPLPDAPSGPGEIAEGTGAGTSGVGNGSAAGAGLAPRVGMTAAIAKNTDKQVAIRANSSRRTLQIQNTSSTLSLLYSTNGPAGSGPAFVIGPLQLYEPYVPPMNDIWIAAATGDCPYTVLEG